LQEAIVIILDIGHSVAQGTETSESGFLENATRCVSMILKRKVRYIVIGESLVFEEEIKGRISLGNKAFYANQDLFKSKLLTKNSKPRMYKTLVRPVVTYACEMWVLKENIKTKLSVFERKVLRRICGPTKERDGTWRIKSNEKLNRLTGNKNIINYIKAQRLAWFGHVFLNDLYMWKTEIIT
jgi:hypothetical protein